MTLRVSKRKHQRTKALLGMWLTVPSCGRSAGNRNNYAQLLIGLLEDSMFSLQSHNQGGTWMVDRFSKTKRSDIMSRIDSKNTAPELYVRSSLHRHGFRFRLHSRELPGRPDIVLRKFQTVVFVHGCFWHGHDCSRGRQPTSNQQFWSPKLQQNIDRDARNIALLRERGWTIFVIWQCELKSATENLILSLQYQKTAK
jgi:DNA mismatch endonuclease (patch repair protein)